VEVGAGGVARCWTCKGRRHQQEMRRQHPPVHPAVHRAVHSSGSARRSSQPGRGAVQSSRGRHTRLPAHPAAACRPAGSAAAVCGEERGGRREKPKGGPRLGTQLQCARQNRRQAAQPVLRQLRQRGQLARAQTQRMAGTTTALWEHSRLGEAELAVLLQTRGPL